MRPDLTPMVHSFLLAISRNLVEETTFLTSSRTLKAYILQDNEGNLVFPEEEVAYVGRDKKAREGAFPEKTLIKIKTTGRRDNMRKEKEAMWDTLSIQAKGSRVFFHDTRGGGS